MVNDCRCHNLDAIGLNSASGVGAPIRCHNVNKAEKPKFPV